MEKARFILAASPAAALVVGITYLQGFWGYFNRRIFPLLTFNEMLAYSMIPMFGYFVATAVGWLIGLPIISSASDKKPSPVADAGIYGLLALTLATAIYFDDPLKWLFGTLVAVIVCLVVVIRSRPARTVVVGNPASSVVAFAAIFLVVGVFCWGRMEAQMLYELPEDTAEVVIDGKPIRTKLIGKVDSYYFVLNDDGRVEQYPEESVGKIVYLQ